MEAIIERCCGLDVHRDSIAACLLTGKADEKPRKQLRTFGTMSHELREMAQWLRENGCTHVAMESTGVYWMAPYKALEPYAELVVGNAQHLSKVPGRKTDVLDSEWLAELLRHGLIHKSFIPPPPIRELRDLTRYRRKLVQSRSAERNRLQKLLEMANIKLASVMSDVFGVSGMDMLRALVEGQLGPKEIAKLARGQLRKKMHLLALALDAPFEEHHRYLLRTQLARLGDLDSDIAEVEARIAEKLAPYAEQHARLTQIPGVDRTVASVIIAEMGVDMSVFASPEACASWAGVSPGNNESAGKRKSGRTPRGNPHLKTTLVEAAQAASRKKGSYLRDKFHRIRARRGYKRAVVTIAHKIVLAVYHMLRTGEDYRDLGEGYLSAKDGQRLTQRLVDRLAGLGYRVTLEALDTVDEQAVLAAASPVEAERAVETIDIARPAESETRVQTAPAEHQSAQVSTPANIGPLDDPSESTSAVPPGSRQSEPGHPEHPGPSNAPAGSTNAAATMPRPKPGRQSKPARKRAPRSSTKPRDPRLPPAGTTLTRIFRGVEYRVDVLENGFEHGGKVYPSISRLATAITGVSCNGYAFFHLTKQPRNRKTPASRTEPSQ